MNWNMNNYLVVKEVHTPSVTYALPKVKRQRLGDN
jgi:hypothetical protein